MSDTIITSRLEGTSLIVESDGNTETYDSQFLVAALLIFIARGSGRIEPEETAKMLDLIQEHFQLAGSESLELLTRAMSELAEKKWKEVPEETWRPWVELLTHPVIKPIFKPSPEFKALTKSTNW